MPGRRNLQRELAAHATTAPQRQSDLYQMMHTQLPHLEHVLIGQTAILDHLHRLGVRRLNGRHLTWRIVNAWRVKHACPLLKGYHADSFRHSPLTTTHALTAWLLCHPFATGLLFRVDMAQAVPTAGSFTDTRKAA